MLGDYFRIGSIILAVFIAGQLIVLGAFWLFGTVFGVRVRRIQLGAPTFWKMKFLNTELHLGWIFVINYVLFAGYSPEDQDDEPGSWRRTSLARRCAVLVAPCLILFGTAVLCLGETRAFNSFIRAPAQLYIYLNAEHVRGAIRVVESETLWVSLGVLSAKMAAYNLLPIPGLVGARILQELSGSLRGPNSTDSDGHQSNRWLELSTTLLSVYVFIRVAWAIYGAL